jgi:hypothetical protein
MRFKMYKTVDGGTAMISIDNALAEIRELGHTFAVTLAERGHKTEETDLMSGLAAYHLLDLKGVNARLDAAHSMVIKEITDAMFDRTLIAQEKTND